MVNRLELKRNSDPNFLSVIINGTTSQPFMILIKWPLGSTISRLLWPTLQVETLESFKPSLLYTSEDCLVSKMLKLVISWLNKCCRSILFDQMCTFCRTFLTYRCWSILLIAITKTIFILPSKDVLILVQTKSQTYYWIEFFYSTETAASQTIMMRENFKGCIRNVKLSSGSNGMGIVDWTDMDQLHNVLLNECPSGSSKWTSAAIRWNAIDIVQKKTIDFKN